MGKKLHVLAIGVQMQLSPTYIVLRLRSPHHGEKASVQTTHIPSHYFPFNSIRDIENVYGLLGLFAAIPDKSAPPPLMLLATALCANSFPLASRPDIRTARSTCVQSSWRHFDHDHHSSIHQV